uniref:Band 3 cytoplasmic domain-containing protein n=1 Tax=Acrobeloides nanus TaxID=290746 RepID=A0A914CV60_9BILA
MSLTEPLPARPTTLKGNDLLSDALYVPQAITLGNQMETPIDNVKQVLDQETKDPSPLFTEMMYLSTELDEDQDQPSLFWEQTSRWIKYEQTVEGDGTRFSKPHITLLNVHSMLQLKNCIRRGVVLLDAETNSFVQLV